ncbi:MAG: FAD-binding protein [Planctomycetales bacterium]|nr:FAD-binding protein [Planctomycetales bacterium]
MISPQSIAETVKSAAGRVLPLGGGTKSALAACGEDVERLDMRSWSGIVAYDPSEYLISAKAGTPLSELQAALAAEGQFLPFDPLFVAQGSTVGGSVASGVSGPNRLLYGGLRDFVMEVALVDGLGTCVRGGGKVVKNAAGFDLPKLFVGSYGRLGILTEVTLKVFPQPQGSATLLSHWPDVRGCVQASQRLLAQPLPIMALEIDRGGQLLVRFAGPSASLPNVLRRARSVLGQAGETLDETQAERQLWEQRAARIEQHALTAERRLVRVATSLEQLPDLERQLAAPFPPDTLDILSFSGAGSLAWLSLAADGDCQALDQLLRSGNFSAVALTGKASDLLPLGDKSWISAAARIQSALDPQQKFASFGGV